MTNKNKTAGLLFALAMIVSMGFGMNRLFVYNDCNHSLGNIENTINNQENLLFIYNLFSDQSLAEKKQKAFKKLIELKEAPLKLSIENFKNTCQSKLRKNELNFVLKGYETYLITKQSLFQESQRTSLNWIRDRFYIDPDYFKVTD